jgi:hypothetical protein
MDWARELGHNLAALRIASAVPLGPISERRHLILQLLPQVAGAGLLEDDVAGRAWSALANIAFKQSDWQFGIDVAQRAAESSRRAGLSVHEAWGRLLEAMLQWGDGNPVAVDNILQPLEATFRRLGDEVGLGYALWVFVAASAGPRTRSFNGGRGRLAAPR